jgi:hypothetical protein
LLFKLIEERPNLRIYRHVMTPSGDPTGGLLRVKQKLRRMPAAKVGDWGPPAK